MHSSIHTVISFKRADPIVLSLYWNFHEKTLVFANTPGL